jgi:hypothetical protein
MDWRGWVAGLISAFNGGVYTAVGASWLSPETFNTSPEGIKKTLILATFGGGIAVVNFLRQSPLPLPTKAP